MPFTTCSRTCLTVLMASKKNIVTDHNEHSCCDRLLPNPPSPLSSGYIRYLSDRQAKMPKQRSYLERIAPHHSWPLLSDQIYKCLNFGAIQTGDRKMTNINRDQEKFARESFSMRSMTKFQLWSITIFCFALLAAVIWYAVN